MFMKFPLEERERDFCLIEDRVETKSVDSRKIFKGLQNKLVSLSIKTFLII